MSKEVSWFIALICSWLVLVLVVALPYIQYGLEPLWKLGGKIMSVIDEAITRFTRFTQGVLDQLTSAQVSNDAQTAKIAALSAALDSALADDNADKAQIAALQAEISTLQDQVAEKINAAVDSLQNPPGEVTPPADAPQGVTTPAEATLAEVPVDPPVEEPVEESPQQ